MLNFKNELEKRKFIFHPEQTLDWRVSKSLAEIDCSLKSHIISDIKDLSLLIAEVHALDFQQELILTLVNEHLNTAKEEIENELFEHGFVRSYIDYHYYTYDKLYDNQKFTLGSFRFLGNTQDTQDSLIWLKENRDLHMDMLRESGARSDAHTYRYVWACNFIREGDTVIDCASGLGYGGYLLSNLSKAQRVYGLDICQDSVNYSNTIYGNSELSYQQYDLDLLNKLNTPRVDTITSFETIEHLRNYENFFKFCTTNLKPDGRLVLSVPYLWVDETGKDPNPFHFHEFDWNKFKTLIESYGFMIEKRFAQTAPGGFKLLDAARTYSELSPSQGEFETEWIIVVATPNLTNPMWAKINSDLSYENPQYSSNNLPSYIDFANGMDSPWLHRQVVQVGQRIEDKKLRSSYALELLNSDTSLQNRLLLNTIISYAEDEHTQKWLDDSLTLLDEAEKAKPYGFTLRWLISLRFSLGSYFYSTGNFAEAEKQFCILEGYRIEKFCSLLVTKTAQSSLYLALILLSRGLKEKSHYHLTLAKNKVLEASKAIYHELKNGRDNNAPFLWTELAEIIDLGDSINRCILALDGASIEKNKLTIANILNSRRFGLFDLSEKLKLLNSRVDSHQVDQVLRIIDINLIKKIKLIQPKKVAFWGISALSNHLESSLKEYIGDNYIFIDSNPDKHASSLTKTIMTPLEAYKEHPDLIIICSITSADAIKNQIPKNIKSLSISISE